MEPCFCNESSEVTIGQNDDSHEIYNTNALVGESPDVENSYDLPSRAQYLHVCIESEVVPNGPNEIPKRGQQNNEVSCQTYTELNKDDKCVEVNAYTILAECCISVNNNLTNSNSSQGRFNNYFQRVETQEYDNSTAGNHGDHLPQEDDNARIPADNNNLNSHPLDEHGYLHLEGESDVNHEVDLNHGLLYQPNDTSTHSAIETESMDREEAPHSESLEEYNGYHDIASLEYNNNRWPTAGHYTSQGEGDYHEVLHSTEAHQVSQSCVEFEEHNLYHELSFDAECHPSILDFANNEYYGNSSSKCPKTTTWLKIIAAVVGGVVLTLAMALIVIKVHVHYTNRPHTDKVKQHSNENNNSDNEVGQLRIEEIGTEHHLFFSATNQIGNYSTGNWRLGQEVSVHFSTNDGKEQFLFKVFPRGVDQSSNGSVCAQIGLLKSAQRITSLSVTFSAVKRDKSLTMFKWFSYMVDTEQTYSADGHRYLLFGKFEQINITANELLENDTLTIGVQGSYPIRSEHKIIVSPSNQIMKTPKSVSITFTWTLCNLKQLLFNNGAALSNTFPEHSYTGVAKFRARLAPRSNTHSSQVAMSNDLSMYGVLDKQTDASVKLPLDLTQTFSLMDMRTGQVIQQKSWVLTYTPQTPFLGKKGTFSNNNIMKAMVNECTTFKYDVEYTVPV